MTSGLRIALVGMPASGKTEATYILKEAYGFNSFRLSVVVRDEVHARKLDETYANLEKVARDLRMQFGEDVIILRAAEQLSSMCSQYCCIDGVRSLREVSALKEHFPKLLTLAIHASPQLRFKRTRKVSTNFTLEEFKWRDQQNLALGLGDVIALADFMVIHDDNSRINFKRGLSNIFRKISDYAKHPWPPEPISIDNESST